MDKIKFIGILILTIILFQIPFLTEHTDICSTLNLILTVIIWLIETRKIKKDTALKKILIYGFIILWCGLMMLISYSIWGKYLRNFSILDAGYDYSVFLVFIISKILSLQFIQDKIDYEPKFLIIVMIIMLFIGTLVGYGIEYVENNTSSTSSIQLLEEILYYINISIFSILLFCTLKINSISKKSVILCTSLCVVVIFIINIIPIKKINSVIASEEELCNIIEANSTTYTYKNISTELGKYLPTGETEKIESQTWDYQQYAMINETYLYTLNSWLQDVNRKNFKNVLQTVETVPDSLSIYIDAGKQSRNYRIVSMIISSIIVISMGSYLTLCKNESI